MCWWRIGILFKNTINSDCACSPKTFFHILLSVEGPANYANDFPAHLRRANFPNAHIASYRAMHTYDVLANIFKHNQIILRHRPQPFRAAKLGGTEQMRRPLLRRLLGLRGKQKSLHYGSNHSTGTSSFEKANNFLPKSFKDAPMW